MIDTNMNIILAKAEISKNITIRWKMIEYSNIVLVERKNID